MSAFPLRRWLVLALVSVFLIPFLVTGTVAFHLLRSSSQDTIDQTARRLREDAAQWDDPAWQAAARAELAAEGADVVLIENGREVYRTTPDPLAGTDGDNNRRLVQRIEISGAESPRIAYIYVDDPGDRRGPPEEVRNALVPIIGLTTLLLTLGGIGWFLGRTVVSPLAATSRAARQIAAVDLDVELPSSRVREVAELNGAFASMSAELRDSLHHQAELEQERRLFIGAIVHDLRTPLFSLRGYLEGLGKGLADTPEKSARYLAVAQEKAEALERLIADLFDFTRLEYLDQAPNRESLSLDALLQRLVDGLQPRAEAKGLNLAFLAALGSCTVDGDTHLLTRAVENLLDNALRHTPSGGRVDVKCHAEPSQVIFSVSDTGPGIPNPDLPRLFVPLYRGETSRNRRTGGAGLGLTIAQRILQSHGGDLTARNRPTGGAIFTGSLPTTEHDRAPASQADRTFDGAHVVRTD